MTWLHWLLVAMAVVGAVAAVRILDRKNRREIVAAYGMPASVDPSDFGGLGEPRTIILFTHEDCRACLAARRICQSQNVPFLEVNGSQAMLDRYGIDGVPTTLVVDEGGTVLAGWVGPLEPKRVRDAAAAGA